MKKTVLFLSIGILFFNVSNAQKYFGKTFPATQQVDEYFDVTDVEKKYTIMGTTELGQGFRTLEKTKEKITQLAKIKGADGIIFSIDDEIYGTTNSGSGAVVSKDKKKDKKTTTISSNSTSTDLKQKKIKATFIKYNKG
jgi:hypothetical protein